MLYIGVHIHVDADIKERRPPSSSTRKTVRDVPVQSQAVRQTTRGPVTSRPSDNTGFWHWPWGVCLLCLKNSMIYRITICIWIFMLRHRRNDVIGFD
jgi:hypothetical protein